jgi:tetratricopeptide (TPR) repeat protein
MKIRLFLTMFFMPGLFLGSCEEEVDQRRLEQEAYASAMAEVKTAMAEKNYDRAWELLSGLRTEAGDPEAEELARLKADVKKKYIAFNLNLAMSLKESDSLNPALKHVNRVLAVDRENQLAQKLRDAIHKQRATGERVEVGKAKPELEKLLDLGREQSAKKQFSHAIETYRKVIRLDEKNCAGHLELGVLYARMGKIKSAAKWYKKFIQICPGHHKAQQIRKVLGDFEKYDKKAG